MPKLPPTIGLHLNYCIKQSIRTPSTKALINTRAFIGALTTISARAGTFQYNRLSNLNSDVTTNNLRVEIFFTRCDLQKISILF